MAISYLKKIENKTEKDLFNNVEFPELLIFGENKEYVRKIIEETVTNTSYYENYVPIEELKDKERFYFYQDVVNSKNSMVASHNVIKKGIERFGKAYRFEVDTHTIKDLQNRIKDNTTLGKK